MLEYFDNFRAFATASLEIEPGEQVLIVGRTPPGQCCMAEC